MSRGAKAIRLDSDQLAELARLVRMADNLRIKDAAIYVGVSPRSVIRFAAAHPASVVTDAMGLRRIRRQWLDAWTEGRNVVAALERAWARQP